MKTKHTLPIVLLCLLGLILFTYYGMPLFAPRIESSAETPSFWETHLDQKKRLTVFNLTLGQSTLKEAQFIFGNRLNLAIYKKIDSSLQIEAYFRETRVGVFTGRIPITLNADSAFLENYLKSLTHHEILPDKTLKYPIPAENISIFNEYSLRSLAFIPTAITLTENDIFNRFGNPTTVITEIADSSNNKKTTTHYLYPEKGIDVMIDGMGRSLIQYINPSEFSEAILDPLKQKAL